MERSIAGSDAVLHGMWRLLNKRRLMVRLGLRGCAVTLRRRKGMMIARVITYLVSGRILLQDQIASAVGTFDRVLECWDRQTREYLAIKVVRSIRKYREAVMIEVDVLEKLSKNDKGG